MLFLNMYQLKYMQSELNKIFKIMSFLYHSIILKFKNVKYSVL